MAQTYLSSAPPGKEARLPFAWWADLIVFLVVAAVIYGVVALAARWTSPLTSTVEIDLSWTALPAYAGLSTLRMAVAYILAAVFGVAYGRLAATSRAAERVMMPLLDIFQSIPILSFMPGVVLGLVALFPYHNVGLELAAVLLIFTSQAWNLAFGFHQSLVTIPKELREAATTYRLNPWQRFTRLELPFGMIPFVWNSMMSWAGGWFFLMASEQFTLGSKDFRLAGLGSYLRTAADAGDLGALFLGLAALVLVIVILDQLLWRPLVAWSDRFKLEQTESAEAAHSTVLTALRRSATVHWFWNHALAPAGDGIDDFFRRVFARPGTVPTAGELSRKRVWIDGLSQSLLVLAVIALGAWGTVGALRLLTQVSAVAWLSVGEGALATSLRTLAALLIGAAWTIPVGVAIGSNPRWARRVQPIVQVVASIPATALFPALLLVMLGLPGGLNLAAVALMLLGTQWYILFNVIAGAMAIPTDLREAATVYKLGGWRRWRYLILPAIFPSLVTGMITATGGAWNASIIAEYVTFGGHKFSTVGLGALIAGAADAADFPLLLAGTLAMAVVVVAINRLLWRRFYDLAEQRYRLE